MRNISLGTVVFGATVFIGVGSVAGYLAGTGQMSILRIVEAANAKVEGLPFARSATATGGSSPTQPNSTRDVYYPGTEALGPNEMRVVALGTGRPTIRPKQAACFLVELGNGDKFLFDIGYGSAERLSAMKIPMDYLDKVFVSHLHMDHFDDLDALWIGGVKMNHTYPLRVWGPSGATPELGTKYAVDGVKRMLNWNATTLAGLLDTRGERLEVTEFDYKVVNEVI